MLPTQHNLIKVNSIHPPLQKDEHLIVPTGTYVECAESKRFGFVYFIRVLRQGFSITQEVNMKSMVEVKKRFEKLTEVVRKRLKESGIAATPSLVHARQEAEEGKKTLEEYKRYPE